ncbi:MAG: HAMP domain-containing histidine kinase [Bacteroidia bacterium]|nr:HAMP domain-containing histidine kinase [Bacteroidia bacterium]
MNKGFGTVWVVIFLLTCFGGNHLAAQTSDPVKNEVVGSVESVDPEAIREEVRMVRDSLDLVEMQLAQMEAVERQGHWFWILGIVLLGAIAAVFVFLALRSRARSHRELLNLNQEMEAQNVEIALKTAEIRSQRDMLEAQNAQIRRINADLEGIVTARTGDLQEALKEVTRSKEELDTFVYRASHDLRGPIVRMQGLATVAKIGAADQEILHYLGLLEYSATNLERVLRKLIQVRHIDNRIPEYDAIDMENLLDEVREDLKSLGPELLQKIKIQPDSLTQIWSDPDLFRVILSNLIENGLIFASGQPGMEVRVRLEETDYGFELMVEDEGEGIAPNIQDKVFEMFYRGSLKSRGNGLGLPLVQSAAVKLGAKVILESEPGKYTRVSVRFPVVQPGRAGQKASYQMKS